VISGTTRVAGLIGGSTAHSLSPFIHNFLASAMGIDAVYATFDVSPEGLEMAVSGAYVLGFAGLNVTAPYKTAVIRHTTELENDAKIIQAVNLLKWEDYGFYGYNTDIYGILATLKHHGMVRLTRATILGAGGAARAGVAALANLGCRHLSLINRTKSSAQALSSLAQSRYNMETEIVTAPTSGDIFIQATSQTPLELENVLPKKYNMVFDMNYPRQNPWLGSIDAVTLDGISMLIFQAIAGFEIMWNVKVPLKIISELTISIENYLDKEN